MTEKCPTCGSDVNVGGEDSTHFYIPVVKYSPYVYKAFITSVFDGDSCTAKLDLGMHVSMEIKIRLYGINAPEIRGADKLAGIQSRDHLRSMILMRDVIIKTYKDKTEKYGRWLADIFVDDVNINQKMVQDGHAIVYGEG